MVIRGKRKESKAAALARNPQRSTTVNHDEPEYGGLDNTVPPPDLTGAGLAEWERIIEDVIGRGAVTRADLEAFCDYCRALSRLRECEDLSRELSFTAAIKLGLIAMEMRLRDQVNRLRQQCGLTPLSRPSIKAIPSAKTATDPKAAPYLQSLTKVG